VKAGYLDFLGAKPADRREVYAEATTQWPTNAQFIEKDLFVCAALSVLFNDDPAEAGKLVFKGGTSLSKAHGLIQRFSEDIDLVIVREELGFKGDRDPFDPACDLSRNKREQLIKDLQAAAAAHIQEKLKPLIEAAFKPLGCEVTTDPGSGGETLLVAYPSAFDKLDVYVRPVIKIEAGARSATLPARKATIRPYVQDIVPDTDLIAEHVQTVDAERTFLDKVLILHGRHAKFRDLGVIHKDANKESRHYYDLALMADNVGPAAIANKALLADVIRHSSLAFSSAWMKMDEAADGRLLISPPEGMRHALKSDYTAMTGMIMGEPPEFDAIIRKIDKIAETLS